MKLGPVYASKILADFIKFIGRERGQKHDRTKAHKGQLAKAIIRRRKRKIPKPRRQQGGRKNRGRK